MVNKILFLLASFAFWLTTALPVQANTAIAGTSASLNHEKPQKPDNRPQRLRNFLTKYNSPLASFTEEIVELADRYKLDWRLVTAISGVESTFCKAIPYNSYNCWGWKNGKHAFQGYPNALETVSRVLSTRYLDNGFDTPEEIGPVYAPPSKTWASKVRFFMNLIERSTSSTFLVKQFSI